MLKTSSVLPAPVPEDSPSSASRMSPAPPARQKDVFFPPSPPSAIMQLSEAHRLLHKVKI